MRVVQCGGDGGATGEVGIFNRESRAKYYFRLCLIFCFALLSGCRSLIFQSLLAKLEPCNGWSEGVVHKEQSIKIHCPSDGAAGQCADHVK